MEFPIGTEDRVAWTFVCRNKAGFVCKGWGFRGGRSVPHVNNRRYKSRPARATCFLPPVTLVPNLAMRAVGQPLLRTDTRLDLALDLKHSPSPTTPRATSQALFPLAGNVDHRRALKRTESYGKGGPAGNALMPTTSTQGSFTPKLPTRADRDGIKPTSLPVFTHEDDENVGPGFGKWHLVIRRGHARSTPPESLRLATLVPA